MALIVGSGMTLHVAGAQQPGVKRTELQRHDLSAPGREAVQARIDFAPAGDVLFIPAGTIHAAKNVGSTNGAELATYIVEKRKPLITLVK